MMIRVLIVILIFPLQIATAQMKDDVVYQLVEKLVIDPKLNSILYAYDHKGDHPLFIAYNDVLKNSMDTSKYLGYRDWKYQIDMSFSDNRVFVRNDAFLFSRLIKYYIQFDRIDIENNKAILKVSARTMDAKVDGLFYFVGSIDLIRDVTGWKIVKTDLR